MRAIPDNNLGYPVLITSSGSAGSAFYLLTPQKGFLVTAAHVLFDRATRQPQRGVTATSYSPDPEDASPNTLTIDLAGLQSDGHVGVDFAHDVAVLHISTILRDGTGLRAEFIAGVTEQVSTAKGIVAVAPERVKLFKDVLIANNVIVFGYPISLALQPIPQLDYARPLLRKGIVAGKNLAKQTIILDCPVYPGNSGGPVLELAGPGGMGQLHVIGIITEYVPAAIGGIAPQFPGVVNSGYSIAAPMDFVMALVSSL